MITQYTDSYSSPSADIQNLVANKVGIFDEYVLMQTGQYEYTALVKNKALKECKQYTISRSSNSSYSNVYNVRETTTDFDYKITNEYYVYSNIGQGKSLNLPVYDGVISISLMFIAITLAFAVVFKGVLFKCLNRKR